MNLGMLLMLFMIAVAAVIGVTYIGANASAHTPTDTFDRAASASDNATYAAAGNLTATGTQVGGGVILLIAGIIMVVVLGVLVLVAIGGKF